MLQKFVLSWVAVAVVLCLAACGGGAEAPDSESSEPVPTQSNAQPEDAASDPTSDSPGEPAVEDSSGLSEAPDDAREDPVGTAGQQDVDMVDVQVGQQYGPGTRVNFPSVGVSFVVPEEWIGQIPQGASAFVMGSTTRQGLFIAMSHQASQVTELAQEFQQPIPLDQGVVVTLQQPAQVTASQISGQVTVSDGFNDLPGYLVGLTRTGGGGVVFIGFGTGAVDYYQELVTDTAGTIQETEIRASQRESSSHGDQSSSMQEWDQFLRGKKLTYLESYTSSSPGGGGFSNQREYYLCRDGRFEYGGSGSLSGGDFGSFTGGNPTSSGQGTWKIITEGGLIGLQLSWNDGTVSPYRLDFQDGATYLDGERHFVTADNPFC